jgi:hypothetical protein
MDNFDYSTVRAVAHGLFPVHIPARKAECSPLPLGFRDRFTKGMLLAGISEEHCKKFLYIWTSRPEYLMSMMVRPFRIPVNSEGSFESVTEHDRQYARFRLRKRIRRMGFNKVSKMVQRQGDLSTIFPSPPQKRLGL